MGLHVSSREAGDVIILELRGRLTLSEGETELLGSHLKNLVAGGVRKLLLNLTNLMQIDSSGVSIMVTTYTSLRDHGGSLKLLCPRGGVREVLRVLRLLETIPSFEDETEALVSFRPWGSFAKP